MKLITSIVLLITTCQISWAQSGTDSVALQMQLVKTSRALQLTDPLYFGFVNYPILLTPQVRSSLSTRMALSPRYSPDYHTKYQVVSTDPVGILAEMLLNSTFYLFERRQLKKYDQKYWRLFWPP